MSLSREEFYAEIESQGLHVSPAESAFKRTFLFGMTAGYIVTKADAESVYRLVTLAAQVGEQRAFLQRVARRRLLQNTSSGVLQWQMYYETDCQYYPNEWITLYDWLHSQGYNVEDLWNSYNKY